MYINYYKTKCFKIYIWSHLFIYLFIQNIKLLNIYLLYMTIKKLLKIKIFTVDNLNSASLMIKNIYILFIN